MMIISMILPLIIMLSMFVLFIWQAVWVALDSRKKGEEYWWIWTIASIIAFPIGLIVYVIITRSDKIKCNNCGKEIPKDINSCPYCGMRCGLFCASCGQKIEARWNYCPNCTSELPKEIKNIKANKKSLDKKFIIIITSIMILLFLILMAAFIGFINFSIVGNSYFDNVMEEITEDNSRCYGYLGSEYETEYTDVRSYNLSQGTNSISYQGSRKKGEIIIKLYDPNGQLLSESKPIKSKKFNDVFISDRGYGTKIEIEYINFKGSFFFDL